VKPLRISREVLDQLEINIMFFFTGKERSASEILIEQDEKSKQDNPEMIQNLHQIKEIGSPQGLKEFEDYIKGAK